MCVYLVCVKTFDTWYKFIHYWNRCVRAQWLLSVMNGSRGCSLFSSVSPFCHAVLLPLGRWDASWKFAILKRMFLQHVTLSHWVLRSSLRLLMLHSHTNFSHQFLSQQITLTVNRVVNMARRTLRLQTKWDENEAGDAERSCFGMLYRFI